MELEFLFFFLPAIGHVLYGLPPDPQDPGDWRVKLHNGDGFSTRDDAPNPDRLISVRAVCDAGVTPLAATGSRETRVTVDVRSVRARPCWVVVETPRTFITLENKKFHGYLQHEGLDDVIRGRTSEGREGAPGREIYSKYVKIALNDENGALRLRPDPVGLPIEIVPSAEAELSIGANLPVRVLVNGLSGADLQLRVSHRVSDDGDPSEDALYRTDAEGYARIPIDRKGIWRLHTISMSPAADRGEAEWESFWASLTFRL